MIVSRDKVKSILGITDTNSDSLIDMYIPIVEQQIVEACRDDFVDKVFDWFSGSAINFINSDNSINLANIGNMKLVSSDSIRVYKSLRNNYTFTVSTVNTDKITCNDIDTIRDEDEGENVYITKITYPRPLELVACGMIRYNLNKYQDNVLGVKSEKIDDYTIQYANDSDSIILGYPNTVTSELVNYRQPYKKTLITKIRSCYRGY